MEINQDTKEECNLKVLLMTGLPEVNASLKEITKHDVIGVASELSMDGIQEIIEDHDDLVLIINKYLDDSDEGREMLNFIGECKQLDGKIRFIIITGSYDRSTIQPLVNAGIFDIIIAEDGLSPSDLENRLDKPAKYFPFELYEKPVLEAKKASLTTKSPLGGFSFFARKEKVRTLMKETIVFWSPFSRGSTTCAYHYAVALAEKYHCQTAVVSLDMFSPRLETVAGIKGKSKVQDALKSLSAGALTSERLQRHMTETSKNVDILPSSFSYDELYYTNPQHLRRLLDLLKGLYDFVVVDVNRYYIDKFTYNALDHADRVICPLKGTTDDLEQFSAYMKEFRANGDFKVEKFQPIINMNTSDGLSFIEIEQILGLKPLVYIPLGKNDKSIKKGMAELAARR